MTEATLSDGVAQAIKTTSNFGIIVCPTSVIQFIIGVTVMCMNLITISVLFTHFLGRIRYVRSQEMSEK